MSWALYRWAWQLEGPLHLGVPPAGSLNRTRLYVPARALWGALTAELSRREARDGKDLQYQHIGESLKKDYRFTYLFPAERVDEKWRAWLPSYRDGLGWAPEGQPEPVIIDRQFRRCLLSTRSATSIDASSDAADWGSLRETECIQTRWREDQGAGTGPVAMVGYVFINIGKERKAKYAKATRRLSDVNTLFVGGDTRYGLGRISRRSFELTKAPMMFGAQVEMGNDVSHRIQSATAWGHAVADSALSGALEMLVGWDLSELRSAEHSLPLWQPGSQAPSPSDVLQWTIMPNGLWALAQQT
jgi:hypothetical protein